MNELRNARRSSTAKARTKGQTRRVLATALFVGLFVAVGLFHVSSRVAVVRAGYELDRVQREHREMVHERERLKLERATLKSAQRLDAMAKTRLGMNVPVATQIIAVSRGPARRAVALSARVEPTFGATVASITSGSTVTSITSGTTP